MLGFGLTVAFIGMGVVFGVLVFLVFVINAITAVSEMTARRSRPQKAEKEPEAAVRQQNLAGTAAAVQDDDGDVIAVITAAILLYEGISREKYVPIRRTGGGSLPAWIDAGCGDSMSLKVFSY